MREDWVQHVLLSAHTYAPLFNLHSIERFSSGKVVKGPFGSSSGSLGASLGSSEYSSKLDKSAVIAEANI
jgi:hypothetical protein